MYVVYIHAVTRISAFALAISYKPHQLCVEIPSLPSVQCSQLPQSVLVIARSCCGLLQGVSFLPSWAHQGRCCLQWLLSHRRTDGRRTLNPSLHAVYCKMCPPSLLPSHPPAGKLAQCCNQQQYFKTKILHQNLKIEKLHQN